MTLLFWSPEFFAVPLKKVAVESCPVTNRTYLVYKGRVVAVGTYGENR